MKALVYDDYCTLDGMQLMDMEDPRPSENEVLVEVHAAGINPIDWKVRGGMLRSRFELDFPDVAGRDFSGRILELGENVTDFNVGDEICGTCPPHLWGSHAELLTVDAGVAAIKHPSITHVDAASIPLVGHTVLTALENTAQIIEGTKVLIHAGAGGVGAFSIQYCKSMGATVYATCSETNIDFVSELGADQVIDYNSQDFVELCSGLDLVYDTVGGTTHQRSYDVLRPNGLLVCLNAAPIPDEAPRDDIRVETPVVSYMRSGVERIIELILSEAVKPSVGSVFAFSDAIEAYRLSETNHARGKIVLTMQ